MKIIPNPQLFWFLKPGAKLDLGKEEICDQYVQQVVSRGCFRDVQEMLLTLPLEQFENSFSRMKHFLPANVRSFWEHYFADYHTPPREAA